MIPVTPRTTQHLVDWCREYQANGTVPQPRHFRFSIGVYQISQGMSWKIGEPVRWQSFCAAAMHFIMCATAYGIDPATWFPETLDEIPDNFSSWHDVLLHLGKAQQQVVYSLHESAVSTRASRFKVPLLDERLRILATTCFSLTPADYRECGCFSEMHILTGDLPLKK